MKERYLKGVRDRTAAFLARRKEIGIERRKSFVIRLSGEGGRRNRRSLGSLFIKPGHGVWENVLPRGDNPLDGRQIPLWPTTHGPARKNGNEF